MYYVYLSAEVDATGYTGGPLKTRDFTPFFRNARYFARNTVYSKFNARKTEYFLKY